MPIRLHVCPGLESHFHKWFAGTRRGKCDNTGLGHADALSLKHGGHAEKVGLLEGMIRSIVTTGALKIRPEKSSSEHMSLGCHGDVVLRSQAETGWPPSVLASSHEDKFSDKTIHRLVVEKGFVNPFAKWSCIVELGLENIGVLGEDVLPIAHPVVRPSFIAKQTVYHIGALGCGLIFLKVVNFC